MNRAPAALFMVALVAATAGMAGCAAESTTVATTPVWSATVPEYGVEYSRTTNVFPWYSKNVTAYSDRVEESGNALLFISWSKTTRRPSRDLTALAEAAEGTLVDAPLVEAAPETLAEELAEPAGEEAETGSEAEAGEETPEPAQVEAEAGEVGEETPEAAEETSVEETIVEEAPAATE